MPCQSKQRKVPPPRLSVLFASEAPADMIFRRGPTGLVRVILWDRAHDKFKLGQWFKGRILVDRSDLSPDGRHMIYFAMGSAGWAIPATGGTWTAISRVPSLKAIALWGHGDTWGGGGMFARNSSYWLYPANKLFLIRDNCKLRRETSPPAFTRVEQPAGWVRKEIGRLHYAFEKTIPKGWILRRIVQYRKADLYELDQRQNNCKLKFSKWDWADWDDNRLVWAEEGCLRAAKIRSHNLGTIRTLYDFNGMKPPAPRTSAP